MKSLVKKILLWINIAFVIALMLAYFSNHVSPVHIWILAFFGLAYPLFLLINFAFTIFWIWRGKWFFIISLLAILAGWGNVGRYMQVFSPGEKKTDGTTFSILSYNVRLFNQYAWEKDSHLGDSILNYVNLKNTDIACFQEFINSESSYKFRGSHIDSMLHHLSEKHIYFSVLSNKYSHYGIATYSRFPIVAKGNINFNNSFNAGIFSDIVINTDTIRVFNVHLQSIKLRKNNYNFIDSLVFRFNQKRIDEVRDISGRLKHAYIKRAHQVDVLKDAVGKSPHPVLVCGDFNDTPVSYTYYQLRGKLDDAFMKSGKGIGNTYRGNFPSFRIDFIFHSPEIRSINYQSEHVNLSDHYPVSCDMVIK